MTASRDVNTACRRLVDVLSVVGDKWTVMVVMVLRQRPHRFNEMKRAIGGISQQMLTRVLKALERDGMIARTVHPTLPPQVEYALSELGSSMSEPIFALGEWARRNIDQIEANRRRESITG